MSRYKKHTYDISEEAIKALVGIADEWGVSRATAIELLIRRERGLPPFTGQPSDSARFAASMATTSRALGTPVEVAGAIAADLMRIEEDVQLHAVPERPDEDAELAARIAVTPAEPVTVHTPWQQLPVVREVDGSTGEVPEWVLAMTERLVLGEELPDDELYRLQRWRRGFDNEAEVAE